MKGGEKEKKEVLFCRYSGRNVAERVSRDGANSYDEGAFNFIW